MDEILHRKFPIQPNFAFAYGSGVFEQLEVKQAGGEITANTDQPMIDYVFAVDNPEVWHRENLQKNPKDYSFLNFFGAEAIANIQSNYGANIYFNTLVEVPEFGVKIKYGVISTEDLCRDLEEWDTFYVSGRLHKPVKILVKPHGQKATRLNEGLQDNLQRALNISLLLLPETFTEFELFETIVGLSYTGDLRVGLAENPQKIQNIVRGSENELRKLYSGVDSTLFSAISTGHKFQQDMSESARSQLLQSLPAQFHQTGRVSEEKITRQLQHIISSSSRTQTFKGLLTAGFVKSAVYGFRKVGKALR